MNIELLAPAGNLEKLKIAVQYGADAVYFAGQQFGLRSAADNFSMAEIEQAIDYVHARNKKAYITINSVLHDDELDLLPEFLAALDPLQPDGVICSDRGVIHLVKRHSRIPIHISTQASVLNSYHAEIFRMAGAKRVVVGRELSIKEAGYIKEKTGIEIEMFVHGAMCMAYSGNCSLSTYIAGRDSNRGGCIQNCRFNYTLYPSGQPSIESHFLSSKDLCGIHLLKEFLAADIDSLKIEGRMKSNLYIASTVRAYSQAIKELTLQNLWRPDYWFEELTKIPHREYTTGSLLDPAGLESVYNKPKEILSEYKLAGTVLEVDADNHRFAFQAKNKLTKGETIEILPFAGEIIKIEIKELINIVETPITVIQPENTVWLPWQEGIEPDNVARYFKTT